MVGTAWRIWGTLGLVALAACSGNVEQRGGGQSTGGTGGTARGGVGGAAGDAGSGSVGASNFGGTHFAGTGSGGAVGFSGGGFGGTYGNAGSGGGGVGGTDGPDSCFAAGTPIATPSGMRPIEELRLGDLVLAYDEHAARVVARPITATFVHPDRPVGSLRLSDGRVLRVTPNHPMYLPDQRRYATVGELTGDERLLSLSASAQTSSLIAGAFQASTADSVTVYNITVAGEHNYFAQGVLVHNKTDGGCRPAAFPGGICSAISGCLDRMRPTNEWVGLNQVVGLTDAGRFDAGSSDSGPSEAGPGEVDAQHGTPIRSIGAAICSGGSVPPDSSYLAFDVVNTLGIAPRVGIYANSSGTPCSGSQIGEVGFDDILPPPLYAKTTQCLPVPRQLLAQLTLSGLSAGTEISNPRFVAGCDCPRSTVLRTECRPPSDISGACLPTESDR
jgi:hypothetical protein